MAAHNILRELFEAPLLADPGSGGTIKLLDQSPMHCDLVSAGAEARTVQAPARAGAKLSIGMKTDGGDITLTVTGGYNEDGDTTFVFTDPGQFIVLEAFNVSGTITWRMLANHNSSGFDAGVLSVSATSIIINDDSADMDLRMESNANADFLNIDGSGVLNGQLAIGAAVPTNPQAILSLLPPANATGVTANQSYYHATILPGGATVIPTGTAPIAASLNIAEPNLTATGTITVAATVRIADAPTEGGSNYALWVDSGVTRFDGNVEFNSAAGALVGSRRIGTTATAITGTTVLTLADSGAIFTVSQGAAYDIDLPSPTVGAGLDFEFQLVSPGANNVTITVAGAAATFEGVIHNDVTSVLPATGSTLTFASGVAALGDTIRIRSTATGKYFVNATSSANGGITIA